MTYISRSERRAETEPAEERRVEVTGDPARVGPTKCSWCWAPVRRHSPEALARCEAAFTVEMNRRLAGPRTVRDVLGDGGQVSVSDFLRRGRRP